jgi:hypothetical protein
MLKFCFALCRNINLNNLEIQIPRRSLPPQDGVATIAITQWIYFREHQKNQSNNKKESRDATL